MSKDIEFNEDSITSDVYDGSYVYNEDLPDEVMKKKVKQQT